MKSECLSQQELEHAQARLLGRLRSLQVQLDRGEGDPDLWLAWESCLDVALRVEDRLQRATSEKLLTTKQLADRLGLKPRSVLKHKKAGRLQPVIQAGKCFRWAPPGNGENQ